MNCNEEFNICLENLDEEECHWLLDDCIDVCIHHCMYDQVCEADCQSGETGGIGGWDVTF